MFQALQDLTKQRDDLNTQIKKQYQATCKEFFDANPNIHLVWTQYAPYPDIVVGEKDELIDHEFTWGEHDDSSELTPEIRKQVKYLAKFIEAEEDLMEGLYGNGYKVFLSKDGASVTEYEHD